MSILDIDSNFQLIALIDVVTTYELEPTTHTPPHDHPPVSVVAQTAHAFQSSIRVFAVSVWWKVYFFLLWLFVCLAELLSHSITHRVWQYKSFIIEFKWHYIGSDFRCWFSVVWHVRKRDTHIDANGKHGVTYTRWYSACSRFGTFQVQFVLCIMWCVTHIFFQFIRLHVCTRYTCDRITEPVSCAKL